MLFSIAFAAPLPPLPWATPIQSEAVKIAVVGTLPDDDSTLAREILARKPDLIVFTGLDARRDLSGWEGEHGILATPARKPNKAWQKRFSGMGLSDRSTPYGTLDLVVSETRWRVLYATTWPEPVARWNEQQFWVPKAAAPEAYDRLLLLLDSPTYADSGRSRPPGARLVVDDVQDVTKPIAMPLVVSGNTGSNEAWLPGGTFGELHLVAGNSGVPFAEASPATGIVRRPPAAPGAEALYESQGYWWVSLEGANTGVTFHQQDAATWKPAWRFVRDGTGWHAPAAATPAP